MLELSGYLENYLWPYYSADASLEHTLSILLLMNEKSGQDSTGFVCLSRYDDKFHHLMSKLVDLYMSQSLPQSLHSTFLRFLLHAFRNSEYEVIKKNTFRYVSLPIWTHLSRNRLSRELSINEQISANWKKFSDQLKTFQSKVDSMKKKQKVDEKMKDNLLNMKRDADFIPSLVDGIVSVLRSAESNLFLVEHMLELLVELLTQLTTRRYLTTLLDDKHFVICCKRSFVLQSDVAVMVEKRKKITKLLAQIEDYLNFEVDDLTSQPLTKQDLLDRANARIQQLQQLAFANYFDKLRGLVFSSMGLLSKTSELNKHLTVLCKEELVQLAKKLGVYHNKDEVAYGMNAENVDEEFVKELIFEYFAIRPMLVERINKLPLYPTEELLWDEDFLPSTNNTFSSQDQALALPKLNLQFLTIYDYFMRNFYLFLMESAHEIRGDLVDAIKRMGPRQLPLMNQVNFAGWARMALPILSSTIDDVGKPWVGEIIPRNVDCSITIDLSRFSGEIRQEWEDLREHDGKSNIYRMCNISYINDDQIVLS
jgi:intron-binding protein aquarius